MPAWTALQRRTFLDNSTPLTLSCGKASRYANCPPDLRGEIDRISKMRSFEKEFAKFLTAYGLSPITRHSEDGWPRFLHLYTRVVEDIPLTVSLPAISKKNKATQGTPDGSAKYISYVTVHLEPARKATQHREDALRLVARRPQHFKRLRNIALPKYEVQILRRAQSEVAIDQ
jgi:hypothetical protein